MIGLRGAGGAAPKRAEEQCAQRPTRPCAKHLNTTPFSVRRLSNSESAPDSYGPHQTRLCA